MEPTSFLEKLDGVRQTGQSQWLARCPLHDDNRASLSMAVGEDDRILLNCHANCETTDIVAKLGLKMADLMPSGNGHSPKGKRQIIKTYDYRDEDGALLFQVVRFDPKDFRQRSPKRDGGWSWSVKGVRRVLYRLPDLAAADPSESVLIVEGERDVDAAWQLGLAATCNSGGAGKWHSEYGENLVGRHVAITPDNDAPGRQHAEQVADYLDGVAASVRIVELPGLPDKGDFSDWLNAGGTVEELRRPVNGAPEWERPDKPEGKTPQRAQQRIGSPAITRAQDVIPEPIDWLWPGRIAVGKLTLLAGDPGLGKSLITIDLAARVSAGFSWPDASEPNPPGGVLMLNAEDDKADTIRPRLDAAKADVSKVSILDGVQWYDTDTAEKTIATFSLERDIKTMEEAIGFVSDCRMIVIDPISAYLGKTDSHKNADIRGLLAPLAEMASRCRVAVLCVTHLNKFTGPAMYRAMGSLAFVAAARAAWGVVKDKNDPSRRLVLPIKCNLAPDFSGLAYCIVEVDGQPRLAWSPEPVNVDVDEAMAGEKDNEAGAERRDAEQWLREALEDGPVSAKDIQKYAKESGHSWSTVRRAKTRLGVESCREGFGNGSAWHWHLPEGAHEGAEDAQSQKVSALGAFGEDGERLCTNGGDDDW